MLKLLREVGWETTVKWFLPLKVQTPDVETRSGVFLIWGNIEHALGLPVTAATIASETCSSTMRGPLA